MAKEEHISDSCAAEGFRLADIDKRIRREMISIYGRPEYGSWPESSNDYKVKRFAELNAEVCQTCRGSGEVFKGIPCPGCKAAQ